MTGSEKHIGDTDERGWVYLCKSDTTNTDLYFFPENLGEMTSLQGTKVISELKDFHGYNGKTDSAFDIFGNMSNEVARKPTASEASQLEGFLRLKQNWRKSLIEIVGPNKDMQTCTSDYLQGNCHQNLQNGKQTYLRSNLDYRSSLILFRTEKPSI